MSDKMTIETSIPLIASLVESLRELNKNVEKSKTPIERKKAELREQGIEVIEIKRKGANTR
ncbi:MAG: hypothetical protein GWO20_16035 [Candidatus Korarchaeota archaeon]|nr:hypothetical protein [Candidatus Korarchaeota archaeon]NIU84901.1 hypothetical protein [Candidatus Thorarchaeota archaeon]NIW14927.1 hypothetical protein [Candidatus Thorarchaeota archaeon]NIW52961.1 hypothetical protein [Candidatus Korarchaeota archaeon]